MNELKLTVSKEINAPINEVFDAWLNPNMLTKFVLPMHDMKNPKVSNDPVEGGRFEIVMYAGEKALLHKGEYLKIDRPNELIFTWLSDHSVDGSEVRIRFNELTSVLTEVELTHVKFADEAARDDHLGGWKNILETLNKSM